ncbi:PTS system beta-glucosides-specific IIC component [Arcanobacterium wilhelmae]|uniref:PTS system beta-glucosides-specific IIC component n=1 Tax=Arcanobacterium wilhelmae TaxID=1803177 RepID=A0ABT9ND34_9ACTO|nr:glucose PTS transporter subunit IIA [Arcanobacterium wilhelmae]MDP9801557.1 PTS system beta-glucosides-specific IIC component [Arcanobacterium wilhelmae]
MTTKINAPEAILDAIGGPENISSFTHCATRLRFELKDASGVNNDEIEKIPGVLGAVPQSGDRYQVIIGGGGANVYNDMVNLPQMKNFHGGKSNADVKDEMRAKARGKYAWVDTFFEFLSDSFRPILGVLLGASLLIALAAVMEALHIQNFHDPNKGASWVFIDAMWRSVLYFLPVMVAYNAAKKLKVDGWLGAAIMLAVMTPEFGALKNAADTVKTTSSTLGGDFYTAHVFGLPMQLNDYGGQVFVPLFMAVVLAGVYRTLKRIIPEIVHMVFVPFFSLIIMIPLTAFLIGPISIWLGSGLGAGLAWLNGNAPFIFAILIPLVYPFLVPLGLHWPLNALMLININTLGYDFIQGPMGAWNFACFGATAGVLFLAIKDRDKTMRQTAAGALAAGLLGGISEPSLYGIHLRFKRIYPRMLAGCLAGGVVIGILGIPTGGVKTSAFVFTSLLTIPVFTPMLTYVIAIAVAFFTAMILVIISGYRTPEQQAEFIAQRDSEEGVATATATAAEAGAPASAEDGSVATLAPVTTAVLAPVAGKVISLEETGDKVFASRALGEGVGVVPASGHIVSPVSGKVKTVQKSGHAYGITSDTGVEVLVHVGIDTVEMKGDGFEPKVAKGDIIEAGQPLVDVDLEKVQAAGYPTTTLVVITNTRAMSSVEPRVGMDVQAGEEIISATK